MFDVLTQPSRPLTRPQADHLVLALLRIRDLPTTDHDSAATLTMRGIARDALRDYLEQTA